MSTPPRSLERGLWELQREILKREGGDFGWLCWASCSKMIFPHAFLPHLENSPQLWATCPNHIALNSPPFKAVGFRLSSLPTLYLTPFFGTPALPLPESCPTSVPFHLQNGVCNL